MRRVAAARLGSPSPTVAVPGRAGGLGFDRDVATRALAEADPRLARAVARVGACRLETRPGEPFDWLLRAVVHQQLAGHAAGAILARLQSSLADAGGQPAERLATLPDEILRAAGLSRAKAASLHDLAARTLDGTVPELARLRHLDDEEIVERLTTIRGVGRWTVEMLLIFGLGRPDVLPLGDYGVRKGFARVMGRRSPPPLAALARRGERWRPWRSVASWYLWRAAELPPDERL